MIFDEATISFLARLWMQGCDTKSMASNARLIFAVPMLSEASIYNHIEFIKARARELQRVAA